MKTDSIFYNIFLYFPNTFFELIGLPATETNNYEFTSREVKQLSFRLDGLFFPTQEEEDKPFYLLEVQFYRDLDLYYRIFGELFLFIRQYKPSSPWQVVIIYPHRNLEREIPRIFDELRNRVTIIYLEELPENSNSLGIELLKIIMEEDSESVVEEARALVNQARVELRDETIQENFIDLVEKIIVYKLPTKTREEIEAMFGLDDLKQTRFYQDAKAEGIEVGRQQEINLVLRLLNRRIGQIPQELTEQIRNLSVEQLENLGVALLDFETQGDLLNWLESEQ